MGLAPAPPARHHQRLAARGGAHNNGHKSRWLHLDQVAPIERLAKTPDLANSSQLLAPLVAPRSGSIQEDAASAMVGLMRLILVILICVLLVKLRAPKHDRRRSAKVWRANKGESHRETTISEGKREESLQDFRINCDSLENLDANNQAGSRISALQQRRHSQPMLRPQLPSWQQQASERRRRLSDTSLATLNLPPGPTGLPFLGYLPFLGNEIHLTLTELSERFGPIYQIFLGGIRVVVLNDAALVRQAFKQTVFSGRPDTQLTRILQGYGIVNSDGALWKEQRAFLHSALRKLGAKSLMSGTNGLEAKIQVSELKSGAGTRSAPGRPSCAAVEPVAGGRVQPIG